MLASTRDSVDFVSRGPYGKKKTTKKTTLVSNFENHPREKLASWLNIVIQDSKTPTFHLRKGWEVDQPILFGPGRIPHSALQEGFAPGPRPPWVPKGNVWPSQLASCDLAVCGEAAPDQPAAQKIVARNIPQAVADISSGLGLKQPLA